MKLEWIEDILAVLDTGSFYAAAEKRFLTPSAFTRRIRGMEETLGCTLFDRTRKPITLLPHVQNLEVDLRDAARRFRELRLKLSDSAAHARAQLILGCQHALTTTVSPRLVRHLGQARQTEMRIRSGTRSDIHQMLLRQEVDLALIYETPEDALQFDERLFDKIPFGADLLIPVANLSTAPELRKVLEAGELPLISYPANIYLGEVMRVHILPGLPRGLKHRVVAETGLTPAVLQLLRQGLGIGWLPKSMAEEALARSELDDMTGALPATPLSIRMIRAHSGGSEATHAAWAEVTALASSAA